jgi:PTS system mannose-specific IID component
MSGLEWKIFLRSFMIQGGWNYRTLLGAGFAWVLLVVPRGRTNEDEAEWIGLHAENFNSHPYLASAALAAVATMEAEGRPQSEIRRFKDALGSLGGSLGDGLFWNGWRPLSLAIAMGMALFGFSPAIVVIGFLALYNVLHIWVRLQGVRMGVKSGVRIGEGVRRLEIPRWAERIRTVGVLVLGLISGVLLMQGGGLPDPAPLLAMGGGLALALGWILGEAVHRWIPAVFFLLIACGFLPILG